MSRYYYLFKQSYGWLFVSTIFLCVQSSQEFMYGHKYQNNLMEKVQNLEKSKLTVKSNQKPKVNKFYFFEQFWKMLFLLVSILMLVLAKKIYLFHTLEQFKHVKKGNLLNLAIYSLPFAVLYIAIDYLIHHIFDDWTNKHILRTDKYTDPVSRQKKSRVLVRWGFNIFYYSCTSVIGYILIKNTSFLPPLLGGSGSVYNLVDYRYLEDATFGMEVYYYIQFGKHVGRYFCHAFIQPEGNYYEYMLHHSLATFLLFFSFAMDMWVIGIFVLITHDSSDVFLALTRMYRQFRHRNTILLNISYVFSVVSWIGLRICAFSYCCVFAGWYQYFSKIHTLSPIEQQVFSLAYVFMSGMMSCLLLMHIYWTYYIIESFVSSSLSQKLAKHSYD